MLSCSEICMLRVVGLSEKRALSLAKVFKILKCCVEHSDRNSLALQICIQSTSVQLCLYCQTNKSFAANCLQFLFFYCLLTLQEDDLCH